MAVTVSTSDATAKALARPPTSSRCAAVDQDEFLRSASSFACMTANTPVTPAPKVVTAVVVQLIHNLVESLRGAGTFAGAAMRTGGGTRTKWMRTSLESPAARATTVPLL